MSLWTNFSEVSSLSVKHKSCLLCSAVVFSVPCPLNSSVCTVATVLLQHYSLHIPNIHFRIVHAVNGRLSEDIPTTTSRDLGEGGHTQRHCVGATVRCDHLTHQTAVATTSGVRSEYWARCGNVERCSTWHFVPRVRNVGKLLCKMKKMAHMWYVIGLSAVGGRVHLKLAYVLYKTVVVIECLCLYRAFLFKAQQL
jgi:hypothetical protein